MLAPYMAWCLSDFLNEGARLLSGNKLKVQPDNMD